MVRHRLAAAFALSVIAACGRGGEKADSSESALLPNSAIFELGHDGDTYRRIASAFSAAGKDLHVDADKFAPGWPLTDPKTAVLNRQGTPMLYASWGYFHTGVDVLRSDSAVSDDVVAPHDGLALVFDWSGNRITDIASPYSTVVALYDPVSHVVTELLHVAATKALLGATDPVEVKKGDVLGKLAPAPLASAPDAKRLANVQVAFVDGENAKLLNPLRFIADYKDSVEPELKTLYTTDEAGKSPGVLTTGKLDLVVEVADKDDGSNRNFEIAAVSYTARDKSGKVVSQLAKCDLDGLYESVAQGSSFRAHDVIDFGSAVAAGQISGAWPQSDVDNAARTFRYALTNLENKSGKCSALDDASSFVDVGDSVKRLDVRVTVWDVKGNSTTQTFKVARTDADLADDDPDAGPAADPDAGPAADPDAGPAVDADGGAGGNADGGV
jgi:hypothetical protein